MRDNTALIERVREGDKQAENRMVEEIHASMCL